MTDHALDDGKRAWACFFEVYRELPRGGPGDPESTRRALGLMTDLPAHPRVLDLGCGPGSGSRNLADLTAGRVTAFDLYHPFVARQVTAASADGAAAAVVGVCGDMGAAPFAPAAFDLIWSEGALYSIGFGNGLAVCATLVRPGGYLAASEAVWTVDDPPEEVRRWWEAEYPDIGSIADKLRAVETAGFEIAGHFTLPASAWRHHYYAPMLARLAALRAAWALDEVGAGVIAQLEYEAAMFDRFGHTYGYAFIVGRRTPAA